MQSLTLGWVPYFLYSFSIYLRVLEAMPRVLELELDQRNCSIQKSREPAQHWLVPTSTSHKLSKATRIDRYIQRCKLIYLFQPQSSISQIFEFQRPGKKNILN